MARRDDQDRDEVERAILDALVAGPSTGMTLFELRSRVEFDIEALEPALTRLREEELIAVDYAEDRSVIRAAEGVHDESDHPPDPPGLFERLRRRFFDR